MRQVTISYKLSNVLGTEHCQLKLSQEGVRHDIRSALNQFYSGGFYTWRGFCNSAHGRSLSSAAAFSVHSHAFMFVHIEGSTPTRLPRRPTTSTSSPPPIGKAALTAAIYRLLFGERGAKRERIETASYKRHTRILPPRRRTNG